MPLFGCPAPTAKPFDTAGIVAHDGLETYSIFPNIQRGAPCHDLHRPPPPIPWQDRDGARGIVSGHSFRLSIDGTEAVVEAPEDATLLEILRDRMGMDAVRFGCGQEACGACMVLVDGSPAFACTRLAVTAQGRDIRTVAGLPEDDPLIAALLDRQAAQCAFCLPGIVMSAKALLTEDPAPTRDTVLQALEPHLCRCGAHGRIVDAILSVAAS